MLELTHKKYCPEVVYKHVGEKRWGSREYLGGVLQKSIRRASCTDGL